MIGGNTKLIIQTEAGASMNSIGEVIPNRRREAELTGWLDLLTQDTGRITYSAKIQESTHIFICDYVKLPEEADTESGTAVVDGRLYDISLIDDPMNMHEQLEIYLKYTGGQ